MRLITAVLAIIFGGFAAYRGLVESSIANVIVALSGCILCAITSWLGDRFFPGKSVPIWAIAIFSGLFAASASVVESSGPVAYLIFGFFLGAAGVVMLLRLYFPSRNILGTNPKNYKYGSNFFLDALSSPQENRPQNLKKTD